MSRFGKFSSDFSSIVGPGVLTACDFFLGLPHICVVGGHMGVSCMGFFLAIAPFVDDDDDGMGQIAGALVVLRVARGMISAGLFRAAALLSMMSRALACPTLLIRFLSSSSLLFCSGVLERLRVACVRVFGLPEKEDVRRCMGGSASFVSIASSIRASLS